MHNGQYLEAVEPYKRAVKTDVNEVVRFSDIPKNVDFLPDTYRDQDLQTTFRIGDNFVRTSDCGPGTVLDAPQSERASLVFETDIETVRFAFDVLTEEGTVGIPLQESFFGLCHGVVFDKFGVMWNLVAGQN